MTTEQDMLYYQTVSDIISEYVKSIMETRSFIKYLAKSVQEFVDIADDSENSLKILAEMDCLCHEKIQEVFTIIDMLPDIDGVLKQYIRIADFTDIKKRHCNA